MTIRPIVPQLPAELVATIATFLPDWGAVMRASLVSQVWLGGVRMLCVTQARQLGCRVELLDREGLWVQPEQTLPRDMRRIFSICAAGHQSIVNRLLAPICSAPRPLQYTSLIEHSEDIKKTLGFGEVFTTPAEWLTWLLFGMPISGDTIHKLNCCGIGPFYSNLALLFLEVRVPEDADQQIEFLRRTLPSEGRQDFVLLSLRACSVKHLQILMQEYTAPGHILAWAGNHCPDMLPLLLHIPSDGREMTSQEYILAVKTILQQSVRSGERGALWQILLQFALKTKPEFVASLRLAIDQNTHLQLSAIRQTWSVEADIAIIKHLLPFMDTAGQQGDKLLHIAIKHCPDQISAVLARGICPNTSHLCQARESAPDQLGALFKAAWKRREGIFSFLSTCLSFCYHYLSLDWIE